jgi:Cof subfamily protein (haloacid dehalogenase superfamily)
MDYELIALDMDDTALTTDKRLTARTIAAMESAIQKGKHVVFSTGRNISIVKPYMDMVRGMRWAVTSAGAAVNDVLTGERLTEINIDPETVKWIIAAAAGEDALPVLYIGDDSYCPDWAPERAAEFHVAQFAEPYRKYMLHAEDVFGMFMENPVPLQKMNLLFTEPEGCKAVYEKIRYLPISFTNLTDTFMEINASGVSKAGGLKTLCGRLGVDMSRAVAVGDSDNDLEMIKAAGLGVAMGNALERVKSAAGAVVADCDSDGAAEAIERFLL